MGQEQSVVLARKYRPKVFADLIGQEALVTTITNAIATGRLAHAYILTGIRGIGKTSSARIIAKGLNCVGPDGKGGMTPNPCGECAHCKGIAADADIDVIEIDAASNTGVDNVREIIEGAKYNPVSARYKIYIIDEVHMLSKQAFNALLKTLEEPPERVKFILATTEIRKVPVTILSRCQRFDLRRVDEETLVKHLKSIVTQEGREADDDALYLIANAGEGSVRDALSLLDQALTQATGTVHLEDVQKMLGLFDAGVLIHLYQCVLKGDMPAALALLHEQFECGADALTCAQDMLELTHWLARVKIMPDLLKDVTLSKDRKEVAAELKDISMGNLTRIWQVLFKGVQDIKVADNPFMALEMLMIKLGYLADVPPLPDLVKDLKKNADTPRLMTDEKKKELKVIEKSVSVENTKPISENHPPVITESPKYEIKTLADLSVLARKEKEFILAFNIENCVRLNSITGTEISCALTEEVPPSFAKDLLDFLKRVTGVAWTMTLQQGGGATLKEEKEAALTQVRHQIEQEALVQAVLKQFPKSSISKFKLKKEEFVSDEDPNTAYGDRAPVMDEE